MLEGGDEVIELEVVLEGRLTAGRGCQLVGREEEVERVFDLTMQELLRLGVVDPSVSGSTVTGEMAMSCIVEAGSWDEALRPLTAPFDLRCTPQVCTRRNGGRPRRPTSTTPRLAGAQRNSSTLPVEARTTQGLLHRARSF
jgi:hypothetical protein